MKNLADLEKEVARLLEQARRINSSAVLTDEFKDWFEARRKDTDPKSFGILINPFEREQAGFLLPSHSQFVGYTMQSMEQHLLAWEVKNTVYRVYGERYKSTLEHPVKCTESFLYGPDAGLLMGSLKGLHCDPAFAHAVRMLGNLNYGRNSAGERKGLRAADVVMVSKHVNFHPSTSMHRWVDMLRLGNVRKRTGAPHDVIEAWITRDGKEWEHIYPDHPFFTEHHPELHSYADGFKYLDDLDSDTVESMQEPSCDLVGSNNYQ